MIEDFLDDFGVLDFSNNFDIAVALWAGGDVDLEDSSIDFNFTELCPMY